MRLDMLLYTDTADDDEPLTKEEWEKELRRVIKDICRYINTEHSDFLKNADGEHCFEDEGSYEYKEKVKK